MIFNFKTRIFVKPYDEDKIWCTVDHVTDFEYEGELKNKADLKEAYAAYFEHLSNFGYELSETQRKKFKAMCKEDSGALDFWSTAKSLVCDRSANYCRDHYFDIFTKLHIYKNVNFEIA
jgi:hypothetical protein